MRKIIIFMMVILLSACQDKIKSDNKNVINDTHSCLALFKNLSQKTLKNGIVEYSFIGNISDFSKSDYFLADHIKETLNADGLFTTMLMFHEFDDSYCYGIFIVDERIVNMVEIHNEYKITVEKLYLSEVLSKNLWGRKDIEFIYLVTNIEEM